MITITGQAFINKIDPKWYKEQGLFIQHLQEELIELNSNATIQVWENHLVLTFRNYKKIDSEVNKTIENRWSITESKTDVGEGQFNYSYEVKFK